MNLKTSLKRSVATAALFLSLTTPVLGHADENLRVNASWGGGDILVLDITDLASDQHQQVAVRLSDLIHPDENVPYLLLQAMDLLGKRTSGVIQIENPLYRPEPSVIEATVPTPAPVNITVNHPPSPKPQAPAPVVVEPPTVQRPASEVTLDELRDLLALDREVSSLWNDHDLRLTELTLQHGTALATLLDEFDININDALRLEREANPAPRPPVLTPDGSGTVVDNIMTVNDIEFFTVSATEGSDFFLVIDRNRESDNVYLLNAVTEADLHALAMQRASESGQPLPPHLAPPQQSTVSEADMEQMIANALANANSSNETDTPATVPQQQGMNWGPLIGIIALLGGLGGAGFWFFKKFLPKLAQANEDDEIEVDDTEANRDEVLDHDDDDDGDYEELDDEEDEEKATAFERSFEPHTPQTPHQPEHESEPQETAIGFDDTGFEDYPGGADDDEDEA